MKLASIKVKNFRGFENSDWIPLSNLTAFVGKNDVGKSTVLKAIELVLDSEARIVDEDVRRVAGEPVSDMVEIACLFTDVELPLILDNSELTTLADECLLTASKGLKVSFRYDPHTMKEKIAIQCVTPTLCKDVKVMNLKQEALRRQVDALGLENVNQNSNVDMRRALRESLADGTTELKELVVGEDIRKDIWERLRDTFPAFCLFKADRENTTGDREVQTSIRTAIRLCFDNNGELLEHLKWVSEYTTNVLQELCAGAIEKIRELDPDLAQTLRPDMPEPQDLKWADVFKNVTLNDESGVSIDWRGSGVRRVVSLGFLLSNMKLREKQGKTKDVVYAFEEIETAQHSDRQRMIVGALNALSKGVSSQVLLTTHSPYVVQALDSASIRRVYREGSKTRVKVVETEFLTFPSLNAVNYHVFGECCRDYHDELYGLLTAAKKLTLFEDESRVPMRDWERNDKVGEAAHEHRSLSYYIRNWIHHPENTLNCEPTLDDIRVSVDCMFEFAKRHHLLGRRISYPERLTLGVCGDKS